MTAHVALMLDLETLSLRPTAKVLQVGYCLATLLPGGTATFTSPVDIWVDDPNGHVDPGTVEWWEKQDQGVRRAVFHLPEYETRAGAKEVFERLAKVMADHDVATVWASPAMFDLPILTNLWEGRKPWRYYVERDLYTLAKLLDASKALRPPANKSHHLASADAFWQARYLAALHSRAAELGLQIS